MRKVTAYVTSDGRIFEHEHDARRYVDNLYGTVLTAMAHTLAKCDGKYIKISEALDSAEMRERMRVLLTLHADIELVEEHGDDYEND